MNTTKNYTPEELKEEALKSLYFFNRYILGFNFTNYDPPIGMEEKPHREMCDFVQDWSSGKKNKLVVIPRKCLKTSCITVGYTLWSLVHDSSMTIILDSILRALSITFLNQIRTICESNELFKAVFGEWESGRNWTGFHLNVKNKPPGRDKDYSISTAGVDSIKVSYHPKLFILDDLVDRETVRTPEALMKTIRHYLDLEPMTGGQGRVVYVGTRWDQDDLISYILENEADEWDIFIRSGINDDGTAYYPQMLPLKRIQERLEKDPYFASCLPEDASILMADWSEKSISKVKVGDEVVGWNSRENTSRRKKSPLVKTKVIITNKRKAIIIKVKLASGRVIWCTPEHRWYREPSSNPNKYLYQPVKIGEKMMFVYKQESLSLTDKEKIDLGWLGGLYDGEGSGDSTCIRIAQSKQHNPDVCEKLEEVLIYFNFTFGYHDKSGVYWIKGGLQERARFLYLANPIRKNPIFKTLFSKDFIKERDEVIEIISKNYFVDVYNIQTETGNYIAYGYCSKNCQYLNEPINPATTTFNRDDIEWYEDEKDLPEVTNYATIDPAGYEGSVGDKTAILPGGVDKTQNLYFYEPYFDRYKPDEIIDITFREYLYRKIRKVGIEENYYRGTLAKSFERRGTEWGTRVRVEKLKHYGRRQRKDDRINALQPWVRDGKVFLKGKKITYMDGQTKKTRWVPVGKNMKILYQQITSYPRAKMSVDLLDAAAMFLEIIKPSGGLDRDKVRKTQPVDAMFGY